MFDMIFLFGLSWYRYKLRCRSVSASGNLYGDYSIWDAENKEFFSVGMGQKFPPNKVWGWGLDLIPCPPWIPSPSILLNFFICYILICFCTKYVYKFCLYILLTQDS
jgi:hypothetical protein